MGYFLDSIFMLGHIFSIHIKIRVGQESFKGQMLCPSFLSVFCYYATNGLT